MKHEEAVPIRGDVRMVIDDGGKRTVREARNMVVTVGREALARLLGGARTGALTKFGVGTGSTAPALTDTTLTNVFRNNIVSVTYPQPNQVRLHWQLQAGEAVGLAIREFGLFFADDVLFSRIVETGVITKSSTMTISGTWTFTF